MATSGLTFCGSGVMSSALDDRAMGDCLLDNGDDCPPFLMVDGGVENWGPLPWEPLPPPFTVGLTEM